MKNWIRCCHFLNDEVIHLYNRGIEEHPGIMLVGGAAFLKMASISQVVILAAPGYIIFYSMIKSKIKRGGDQ